LDFWAKSRELAMADRWVKCSDSDSGDPIYVNLGSALTLQRVATQTSRFTRVIFLDGSTISLQETPDQILALKTM
jgi:hypothetical protein